MSNETIAHICIAALNLATAVVSWVSGRRHERRRIMDKDRRKDPRY